MSDEPLNSRAMTLYLGLLTNASPTAYKQGVAVVTCCEVPST